MARWPAYNFFLLTRYLDKRFINPKNASTVQEYDRINYANSDHLIKQILLNQL